VPVLAVHDEIVVECRREGAEEAATWLMRCMEEAMGPLLEPIEVVAEVDSACSWGS
jgi:DNA polymerase I-like protein with 3'-5' exonuclease and polymerase domains